MNSNVSPVRPASEKAAPLALELLLAGVPETDRAACALDLLMDLPREETGIGGLFIQGAERIESVALAQLYPGRTASVWRPRFVDDRGSVPDAAALLRQCDDWAKAHGARLVQSLLELEDAAPQRWFTEAGYQRLARLAYLCWIAAPQANPPESEVYFTSGIANANLLAHILEATYAGTLDCPALNGVRETVEVLEGYRAIGTFREDVWLLAFEGEEPVGCLILADHPLAAQLELVYMGVVPDARGRGIGHALIAEAQRLTVLAGRERLVLAADTANLPALRQYQRAGFGVWDQREVYAKVLASASG